MLSAWVVWTTDVSVAIFSPTIIDSTRSKWISMEYTGTADASTVSSPTNGSDTKHWVQILPDILKPPM